MKLALIIWLAAAGTARAEDPALVIQDPEILSQLEEKGLSLAERLIGQPVTAGHNAELKDRSAAYRSLLADLGADLYQLTRQDKLLGPGMEKSHRLFDAHWLASPAARFELAGIVNRLDRRSFHPDTCGEVRFIYRLRYSMLSKGHRVTSRLPFTINLVSFQQSGEAGKNCDDVAKLWLEARRHLGKDRVAWLTGKSGPLSPAALSPERLKSLEVNFQSVRWPSTIRPDLGAHAEYMLRVFEYDEKTGSFVMAPLENTIDVDRLRSDAKLKAKLLTWLKTPAHQRAVEGGIAVIPDEFLAKRATSVSPRGLTRLANRPFKRLFTQGELDDGTLRRLDDLSCIGCHQGRSVAGFHFLGIDRADTPAVNAINVTGSPHFNRDLPRRLAYLDALDAGKIPVDARPLSERAATGEGGYGSHCGLGAPAFKDWHCGAGLTCKAIGLAAGDDTVGQCFPDPLGEVGDPCELGILKPDADAKKDRIVDATERACRGGVCEVNQVGFPEGMCAVTCEAKVKDSSCGSIALLQPFNTCLGQGKPFTKCIAENVRPAGLRACDEETPCRDDYLCARTESGAGACIPPYFLFQMRVDGHPKPD